MASCQNTSEYYCGTPTEDMYPEHCTNPNVFFNQRPTNYRMHGVVYSPENYEKQGVFPTMSPHVMTCDPALYGSSHFYENSSAPQYNVIQMHGVVYSPENNKNQGVYPTMSPNVMTCNPTLYESSHFYENSSAPQYNLIQYTPLKTEPVTHPMFHLEPRSYHNNNCMAKIHRAHITILPSSKGSFKAVVKRKRKRTVFTTEQVEALEDIFKTKQYVTRYDRQHIVNKLQLSDKAVKIWFQNRRSKIKRMQGQDSEEQEDCSSAEHLIEEWNSPEIARLDSVESKISKKKTDEYGFVTLDDGVMGDLMNVIDNFLTKSSVEVAVEETAGIDSSPVYEPISPASISDSNEEDSSACWKPSEPKESLQRLFELQTMLSL